MEPFSRIRIHRGWPVATKTLPMDRMQPFGRVLVRRGRPLSLTIMTEPPVEPLAHVSFRANAGGAGPDLSMLDARTAEFVRAAMAGGATLVWLKNVVTDCNWDHEAYSYVDVAAAIGRALVDAGLVEATNLTVEP